MQGNNQLKEFQNAFVTIKHNISTDDRDDAEVTFDLSRWTVEQYMNGKGTSLDTSGKLLMFFTEKIKQRQQLLQQVDELK